MQSIKGLVVKGEMIKPMEVFVEVKPNIYYNRELLQKVTIPNRESHLVSIKSQMGTYAEEETLLIEKLMPLKPDEREPYLELLNSYTNEKMRLSMLLEQESKWWDLWIVTNNGTEIQFRYESETERNTVYGLLIGKQL